MRVRALQSEVAIVIAAAAAAAAAAASTHALLSADQLPGYASVRDKDSDESPTRSSRATETFQIERRVAPSLQLDVFVALQQTSHNTTSRRL